nr:phage integrase family protein [Burkholderia sp. Ac-20384]
MEASLVEALQLEHRFDARLVARLATAVVIPFAKLLAVIRARRLCWYRAVPRLDAIGAQRIAEAFRAAFEHPGLLVAARGHGEPATGRRPPMVMAEIGRTCRRGAARGAARTGRTQPLDRAESICRQSAPGSRTTVHAAKRSTARTGAKQNGGCCG